MIQVLQFNPIKEFVGTPGFSFEVVAATAAVLLVVASSADLVPAKRAVNLNIVEGLRP